MRYGGVNLTITNKDISDNTNVDVSDANITFAEVTENYPNRIYFTVDQSMTVLEAYDIAHWNFGTISGNYWVGDCSFNTDDTSAVLIDDNTVNAVLGPTPDTLVSNLKILRMKNSITYQTLIPKL